jgi:dynein heavy chain
MERAAEQKNVIKCCKDDILLSSLPSLQEDLDFCEKRLETYLEDKRNKFPRFYFVSNADLLKILSIGSDPQAVQDDFEKLFDAITNVYFDESDRRLITDITETMGNCEERIPLAEGVHAEGLIEDWLCKLEKEMQRSVRAICQRGSQDCVGMKNLKEFVAQYPSQVALLGIQMLWNMKVSECLEKSQKEKIQELQKKSKDIVSIMSDLTAMCLDTTINKQQRIKVETCVTIHVRQREVFAEILDLAR